MIHGFIEVTTGAAPDSDVGDAVAEWQRRRDVIIDDLVDLPLISAAGGWSILIDVGVLGFDSFTASDRLLEFGKVAATPMRDWGDVSSDPFIRFVFSNEPVERLRGMDERVRKALG